MRSVSCGRTLADVSESCTTTRGARRISRRRSCVMRWDEFGIPRPIANTETEGIGARANPEKLSLCLPT